MFQRDEQDIANLVNGLRHLPSETEWVEFKKNNSDPRRIGEYISALANGAALAGRTSAYVIWGVEDSSHEVVGTGFQPSAVKRGNEPLENWLLRSLNPQTDFRFHEARLDEKRVVVLEIEPASQMPVSFRGDEFIRVGSVTKKLREHPQRERALWLLFSRTKFEDGVAAENAGDERVLKALDWQSCFDMLGAPLPNGNRAILDALSKEDLIASSDAGGWDITNLGAILFAKNLADFPRLRRKTLRVIQYDGAGRLNALREREHPQGYAVGFERMVDYIMTLTPSRETIENSLRKTTPMFPELAIRELVANALIHQDFSVTGAGPMVEIFDERIEITNPGAPLVDTLRFVDTPPKSRNETLASIMRRLNICEERGTGIDKVVLEVELNQLPAPLFEKPGDFTRATLFARKNLSDMDWQERIRACYMHACLRYVENRPVNNSSVRKRFDLPQRSAARASGILKRTVEAGFIVIRNPEAGTRSRTYLPFWTA